MEFKIIFISSRCITIELEKYGIWFAKKEYAIYLDEEKVMISDRTVQSIDGLEPGREYKIHLESRTEKSVDICFRTQEEFVTLDVKKFGAKGDGISDDTLFIQSAIQACPKGGRVWIPKGVYKVTSLFLKSNITIDIGKETVISANTNYEKFPILPGMTRSYDGKEEYNLGTWEGNPLDMFASIITGIDVTDVVITGFGVLDGNSGEDNWWNGDGRAKIGGAWRPRMIFLNRCKRITVQGITVQNSPAWNLHPYFSDDTKWIDLKIINPKVSPNTDGMDPESVNGLLAVGIYFSLGDDCVAIKSGKYYMGHKYKKPSENLEFRQCYMKHGHGAITLGSEMSAGVRNLVCRDCLFEDTDRGLRIKTRRGRGEEAVIDQIRFENIRMNRVLTPIVVNSYYWCCDPDGHSEYVRSKEALPIDEKTPVIRELCFNGIYAENCQVAGTYIYGLPEMKIQKLEFQDVHVSFAEICEKDYPAMMADLEPCSRLGMFIHNVEKLVLKNVTVEGQDGDAFILGGIKKESIISL